MGLFLVLGPSSPSLQITSTTHISTQCSITRFFCCEILTHPKHYHKNPIVCVTSTLCILCIVACDGVWGIGWWVRAMGVGRWVLGVGQCGGWVFPHLSHLPPHYNKANLYPSKIPKNPKLHHI